MIISRYIQRYTSMVVKWWAITWFRPVSAFGVEFKFRVKSVKCQQLKEFTL